MMPAKMPSVEARLRSASASGRSASGTRAPIQTTVSGKRRTV
jgi:hypothetical protein